MNNLVTNVRLYFITILITLFSIHPLKNHFILHNEKSRIKINLLKIVKKKKNKLNFVAKFKETWKIIKSSKQWNCKQNITKEY